VWRLTALKRHRNSKRGFRDRIHGRGDEGALDADVAGKARRCRHVRRREVDVAAGLRVEGVGRRV